MEKLQQTLAQSIITDPVDEGTYRSQMAIAFENLEALESFVNQVITFNIHQFILLYIFLLFLLMLYVSHSHVQFYIDLIYLYIIASFWKAIQ